MGPDACTGWQVLDTPEGVPWWIPATHVLDSFKQEVPKRESKERSCDAPGRIQGERLAAECGRRWDERYTSHANRAGFMQTVYSSIYVEGSVAEKAELVDFHHRLW